MSSPALVQQLKPSDFELGLLHVLAAYKPGHYETSLLMKHTTVLGLAREPTPKSAILISLQRSPTTKRGPPTVATKRHSGPLQRKGAPPTKRHSAWEGVLKNARVIGDGY